MKKLKTLFIWPISALKRVWKLVRKYPKSSIVLAVALIGIYALVAYIVKPEKTEYITEIAVRGDLQQTVEAIGEVISERDLKLQFPITGIVEKVLVGEGDRVTVGQELARLRSGGLYSDIQSAAAQVAAAKADLQEMEEGARPEEIEIKRATVENKRSSLEAAENALESAERNLKESEEKMELLIEEGGVEAEGYVLISRSNVSQYLSTALTAAEVMDDVFNNKDLLDVFIKHEPGKYDLIRSQHYDIQMLIRNDITSVLTLNSYQAAISALEIARQHVADLADILNQTYAMISSMPETPYFSATDKESSKSDVATERTNVQSALSSLDTAIKNFRDAVAGTNTTLAAEEATVVANIGKRDAALADIQTYTTALRMAEAELNLQLAGSRQTDIDAARARLNQYYAQLQRAKDKFEDTFIRAPLDGTITKVDLKEGELLSTSFATDAAITMLGDSPYRVEMFISEIDIPKVMLSQTGSIELDAFKGEPFILKVTELDPVSTDVDGVSKYRSKLDFVEQSENQRIGMTGDAEIYTDFVADVIIIPGRAVYRGEDGKSMVKILTEKGEIEEREVLIGMEGEGGDVEVIVGVDEGENVIVLIKD